MFLVFCLFEHNKYTTETQSLKGKILKDKYKYFSFETLSGKKNTKKNLNGFPLR